MLPPAADVMATLEATWPPEATHTLGDIRLRQSNGGGKRVTAARSTSAAPENVAEAEAAMRDMGQTPMFQLTEAQPALDAELARRGYEMVDPTLLMARAPTSAAARAAAGTTATTDRLWDEGGVGADRRAVMARVQGQKDTLRAEGGAVFVALGPRGAMFHALYVSPAHRRQGIGRRLTKAAMAWAHDHDAPWISLAVVEANAPATALYTSLGFQPVGRYWYRMLRG